MGLINVLTVGQEHLKPHVTIRSHSRILTTINVDKTCCNVNAKEYAHIWKPYLVLSDELTESQERKCIMVKIELHGMKWVVMCILLAQKDKINEILIENLTCKFWIHLWSEFVEDKVYGFLVFPDVPASRCYEKLFHFQRLMISGKPFIRFYVRR